MQLLPAKGRNKRSAILALALTIAAISISCSKPMLQGDGHPSVADQAGNQN